MFGGTLAARTAGSDPMFDWLTSENHAVAILQKDQERSKRYLTADAQEARNTEKENNKKLERHHADKSIFIRIQG